MSALRILDIDDSTMIDIITHAAAARVALVERDGRIAACGIDHIPPGWHRIGAGEKRTGAPT